MKYIETIDLGYDENRKVVIEKVNFRKSFLEEYSTLFTEGIIDKEVTLSYEDTTKIVSLSSPKTDEIKTYCILGNHDYMNKVSNKKKEIYAPHLVKEIANNINGLEYAGVLKTYINFYDEHRIMLYHSNQYGLRYPNLEHDLVLKGHGHTYYINEKNNTVHLPSLCKDTYNRSINSGFIILSLLDNSYEIDKYRFNNGQFHKEDTKKLVYKK